MNDEPLADLVHERPLLFVAAAGALGIVLGGVLFARLGRLMFVATVGYIANELWHGDGRLGLDQVIERLPR